MLKWWYKKAENGVIEYTFGLGRKQVGKNFIFRLKKENGCIWFGRIMFSWFFIPQEDLDRAANSKPWDKYDTPYWRSVFR